MKKQISSFFRHPGWFAFLAVVFLLGNSFGYSSSFEVKSDMGEAWSAQKAQNETIQVEGIWFNPWPSWNRPIDCFPAPDEFVPYDVPPKFIKKVMPIYPSKARLLGIEGTVWVQVLVDKHGRVRDVRIYRDSGTNVGFEQASIRAAMASMFSPAMSNGEPIAVWVIYSYVFRLGSK